MARYIFSFIGFLFILWLHSRRNFILLANCNPLFLSDPIAAAAGPMYAMPMAGQQFMLGPQQLADPYGAASMHPGAGPFIFAPAAFANPALSTIGYDPMDRRYANQFGLASAPQRSSVKKMPSNQDSSSNDNSGDSDEKRAMEDLPLSFLDPDPPSSIAERMSESFSAIGEGVRNHFRSMSENFSDTVEDIKEAWKSDSSKKRG